MQQYPFLVNQDNSGLAGPVHAVAELAWTFPILFGDVTLVTWNWSQWEYLHYRKQQKL